MSKVAINTTKSTDKTVTVTIAVDLTWNPADPEQAATMQRAMQDILAHASEQERASLKHDLDEAVENFQKERS